MNTKPVSVFIWAPDSRFNTGGNNVDPSLHLTRSMLSSRWRTRTFNNRLHQCALSVSTAWLILEEIIAPSCPQELTKKKSNAISASVMFSVSEPKWQFFNKTPQTNSCTSSWWALLSRWERRRSARGTDASLKGTAVPSSWSKSNEDILNRKQKTNLWTLLLLLPPCWRTRASEHRTCALP